ncbi:putative phosphoesterase [Clostridium saccharoperbutylacetonicum]|uniref:Putative phosphoesterase n=1 Tax=Clostridium saccharoperbutylacetonicum N1-4(HMT) TaxID=931276 RepID=M1MTB0_9CLOT|nr:metallophosphoesterase family protein [Clostridium saccharoperbutylacetonicum]AGF57956.1 putative phosphoesterase [Clostridium saccharoperbutylacetonicum N1-4(HMT)]NRT61271.1 putative phosphoesterase [Clostridium saccharoperbutylacetonicum]NSB24588.1 putative phosphoesterase [Clostridium saccharoperbutylacetonicum]NSB43963.1 putative phosphoesterase [Clostridium saccharoperbutylacetonicum]
MKVAVLSDVHGNGVALQYTISDLKKLGVKKIIILGVIVMKGPMPSESIELLKDNELEIIAWIKGNTDLWLEEITDVWMPRTRREEDLDLYYKYAKANLKEEQMVFLKELPLEASININGINLLCVHGTPKSISEAIDGSVPEEEIKQAIEGVKEQVILSGHSHTSFIGEVEGRKIFNVGSVGNSLDGDNRISYGILEFDKNNVNLINRRINYPVNEIINIAIEDRFPLLEEYKKIIISGSN